MGINLDPRYQEEAYKKVQESLNNTKKAGIIMPTGTGKSFIALKLIEDSLNNNEQILYVSPSPKINARIRKLIKQNYSEEKSREILSKIKFTTYHSLHRRYRDNIEEMKEYNSGTIILDEVHRSGALEWSKAVDYLLENNSDSKILGMTATPLRNDGQNMIEKRCGNIAYELKLSEAVARGILKLPEYYSCKHISEEDIETLQDKLELVEDEKERKYLEEKLQKIKKQVENGKGLKEIYNRHLKKDGKYLMFCNPGDDIEKLQQQAQREGIFNDINKNQKYLTIESSKTEQENQIAIDSFERNEKDVLKLLYLKNMLNEGYHDEEITGEIMSRPTQSYILYLQQLGRVLSRDRKTTPIVLDLVGNIKYFKEFELEVREAIKQGKARGETVYDEKVLESFKILEEQEEVVNAFEEIENSINKYLKRNINIEKAISEIEEWCKKEFEGQPKYLRRIPVRKPKVRIAKEGEKETKEQKESRLSILDYTIRNTEPYIKYMDGRKDELEEYELNLIQKYVAIRNEYNYRSLNNMAHDIIEIENWCKENFEEKPKYLRRMPVSKGGVLVAKNGEKETEEQKEKRIGTKRGKIETSDIYIKYINGEKDELGDAEKELIEKYIKVKEEYDYRYLNIIAEHILELEEWCIKKNEGKSKEEYKMPSYRRIKLPKEGEEETEEQRESRLGLYKTTINISELYSKYISGKKEELNEVEIELMDRYYNILNKYNVNQLELLMDEIEEWCKEKFKDKPKHMRRLPKRNDDLILNEDIKNETEEQIENRLGRRIHKLKQRQLKQFLNGDISNMSEKDIEQLQRFIRLQQEYDIPEIERRILRIEEWCAEKFKNQPRYMRRLPRQVIKKNGENLKIAKEGEIETEEQKELKVGQDVKWIDKYIKKGKAEKKFIEKYLELKREYDNEPLNILGNSILELEEWCEEQPEDCKRMPRSDVKINGVKVPAAKKGEKETEEQRESRLGRVKYSLQKRDFYQKYIEGKTEEMTEAEIELVEKFLEINEKYGKSRVTGQEIGKATFDVSVKECDKADSVLENLVEKEKYKGEIKKSDE